MTDLSVFNNSSVTMSSREIAQLTEKRHDHVLTDIRKMFEELGLTSTDFSGDLPDSYGRLQTVFNLPKRECLILVSGYSVAMRAKIIDRWQELETKQTQPQPQQHLIGDVAASEVRLVDVLKTSLNLSNSSHLGLVQHVLKKHGQHDLLPMLPSYAVDAPTSSTTGSSEPTSSASELLKIHESKLSAKKFNELMIEMGFLHELTRPSTSSPTGIKKFKALTVAGLEYGKNLSNPNNPRETQPHWYKAKFKDLLNKIA
jgi:hypothetical protein